MRTTFSTPLFDKRMQSWFCKLALLDAVSICAISCVFEVIQAFYMYVTLGGNAVISRPPLADADTLAKFNINLIYWSAARFEMIADTFLFEKTLYGCDLGQRTQSYC